MENKNDFEKTTNSENSTEIIYLDDFESIKLKEHENNKKLRLQNSSSGKKYLPLQVFYQRQKTLSDKSNFYFFLIYTIF